MVSSESDREVDIVLSITRAPVCSSNVSNDAVSRLVGCFLCDVWDDKLALMMDSSPAKKAQHSGSETGRRNATRNPHLLEDALYDP